jgi:DNA repair protein SbcC/Rad50
VQWAAARARQAEESAHMCALREQDAVTVETDARSSLEAALELRDDQRRHAHALTERDRLASADPDHSRQVERLDRARRAAGVAPLAGLAAQHAQAARRAGERSAALTRTAATRIGVPATSLDDGTLVGHRDRAVAAAADARALLPREETLDALLAEVEDASVRSCQLTEELEKLDDVLSELPAELAALREHATVARDAERDLGPGRVLVDTLRRRREAAGGALRLTDELDDAVGLHRRAIDDAQELKEAWLQIQEQRIRGIAADLAGRLVVGDACPVCGSADHPRPASSGAGTPDADAEKAARRKVDDAEATRHAHDVRVRELAAQLATARAAADGELDSIRGELADAEVRLERLAALAGSVAERRARVEASEARHAQLVRHREIVTRDLTVITTSVDRLRAEVVSIERELAALLSGSGCDTLTTLATRHDAFATVCTEALLARDELRRADQTARTVRDQLEEAATAAGFADAEEASLAVLDPDELTELDQQVRQHEQSLARAEEVLAEPGLRERAALPPPDLPALETQHEAAVSALTEAATAVNLARGRAERVAGLTRELRSALDRWAPVRAEHDLVTQMAALVEGTSADNRLRMRLSGYVLASRLAQVVSAANLRLTRMSDRRYTLEHTGGRGAGENRGGLSLLVRDEWSGEARDPATLSGGETFVVSLALALGLADVIAHEVGGAELDTLFVDEGFGSLDAETLDDVMDTLDSLREGGRVVGVVSHVTHLRERIPTQLHVAKRRHGSTVRTVRAG